MKNLLELRSNYFPYSFQLSGHTGDQAMLMGKYKVVHELKNNYPIFKHQYYDFYCKKDATHLIFVYNRISLEENTGAIRVSLRDNAVFGEYFGYNNFWNHDIHMSLEIDDYKFSIPNYSYPKNIILYGDSQDHKNLIGEYNIVSYKINDYYAFKNIYFDYFIYKSSIDNNWLITYNYNDIGDNIAAIKTNLNFDNSFYTYTYDNIWEKNDNLGLLLKF